MMEFLGCRHAHRGPLAGHVLRRPAVRRGRQRRDHLGPRGARRRGPRSPVVVIGCGESGILAGIRLTQAGLPFTIIDKNDGPGGTWWENRYPGARVDIGSHQYCYSFEPADHWSEYYCQQPELRDYFAAVVDKYGLRAALPVRHRGDGADLGRGASARWQVEIRAADGSEETLERGSSSAPSAR